MADKSKQDLVIRALTIIGVIGTGQEPAAENVESVGNLVSPMLDRLEALRVTGPIDEAAIHPSIFEPLALLLANEAREFGVSPDPATVMLAESQLRAIYASRPTYEILAADYF